MENGIAINTVLSAMNIILQPWERLSQINVEVSVTTLVLFILYNFCTNFDIYITDVSPILKCVSTVFIWLLPFETHI